jgi:hypothetical protein
MNLSIGYSGGSGGFLLLHLLLLSDQYHVEFQQNKSFAEAFEQQWKITKPTEWKLSETWPDNSQTYASQTALHKIYFYCNPYDQPGWAQYPGSTVILYTDYHSQTLLAHYKRAHWYYKRTRPSVDMKFLTYRELLKNWRNHYNQIKDPSWPKCVSMRDIDNLPEHIQKEVLANPYTCNFLNYQYHTPVEKYHDQMVFDKIVPLLKSADYAIRLQDLVNSNGAILAERLKISHLNDKQLHFLQQWKKMHPPDLLDKIGIVS